VAEEFSDWKDSRRRIDLLAIDRNADLVVIELKRDSSAHMDLQAPRYAAMVAPMTFPQVVQTYSKFLDREGRDEEARKALLDFIGADESDEEPVIGDARLLLVSGDFSKELTTTVLWLNGKGLDIRCVQLQLYRIDDALIADLKQILPVPGTEEYQVRIQAKRAEARRKPGGTMEAFWRDLPDELHSLCRSLVGWLDEHFSSIWPGVNSFVPTLEFGTTKHHIGRFRTDGEVALYFDRMANKPPFSDDSLRRELMKRLNSVEGIDLPVAKLERRPRFELKVLDTPQAMRSFKETVSWWIERVRVFESEAN
jgi:hypothetical protein